MARVVPLPPRELRQGGVHFLDDARFVASGREEVARLRRHARLRPWSAVLDLGCGAGRLAVGLAHTPWFRGRYLGVEVQRRHVEWCTAHLTAADPRLTFALVDAPNDRYNPRGSEPRRLPAADGSVGVLHAFSVFTHMRADEVTAYLAEFRRVLAPGGRGLFTAFAEPDVPDVTENPQGYGPMEWDTPLHCVRYSTAALEGLVAGAGLRVVRWWHRSDADGQSAYVVARMR